MSSSSSETLGEGSTGGSSAQEARDATRKLKMKVKHKLETEPTLTTSSTQTSASAAVTRSVFLYLGFLFRRPSKLFRPSRVDTWGGLRYLAVSAEQTLSPSFIRTLIKSKRGILAVTLTILPPLLVNTTLGFLLFTSHSFFSLSLAKLPFFHNQQHTLRERLSRDAGSVQAHGSTLGPSSADGQDWADAPDLDADGDEDITLHNLLMGPRLIPNHPTLLSAISGAGAGLVQGAAFTPIENLVRLLRDSTSSFTTILVRSLHLPITRHPLPSGATSPIEALKQFLSSDTWVKSHSWWTGWRWGMARDALSYSVFFASFDITRRVALRVRAFFSGSYDTKWDNVFFFTPGARRGDPGTPTSIPGTSSGHENSSSDAHGEKRSGTPTVARVAQAVTIVAGGVTASIAAEISSRPFRHAQRLSQLPQAASTAASGKETAWTMIGRRQNPVLHALKTEGFGPFFRSEWQSSAERAAKESRMRRAMKRFGWRMAAVGPWGFGFLVWAWVGGEV